MTIPPIAAGRMIVRMLRQRATPSASAASRRPPGTSLSTSWVERAISGTSMIESATEPAKPDCCLAVDDQDVDEDGDDDRRQAVHHVHQELDRAAVPRRPAYSLRKSAIRTPIGIAISVPMPTMIAVPTIAERFRRRHRPARSLVTKSQLIALTPADHGEDDDHQHRDGGDRGGDGEDPSTPADQLASAQVAGRVSGWVGSKAARGRAVIASPLRRTSKRHPDPAGQEVGGDTDHQQDQREVVERGGVQGRDGAGELGRWIAIVPPGLEQRDVDSVAAADHLGDGDRLAERAAEAEQRGGGHARERGRQDDAADHLPAGRAERRGSVLELPRDRQEQVAGDRGDDRDHHDREDQPGGEDARAGRLRRSRRAG